MKRSLIISVFFALSAVFHALAAEAGAAEVRGKRDYPRFTFGIETSYVLTFLNYSHFNFISMDGGRRDVKIMSGGAYSNGQILVSGGVNISPAFNLSLYTGYSGVYSRVRVVPVALRLSWFSGKDPMRNRWMAFLGAGAGFNNFSNLTDLSAEGKIGGGYRISLNRSVKLDFLLAFQEVFTHPRAYESDAGNYVPSERLRRNDAFISALTFGFALVF